MYLNTIGNACFFSDCLKILKKLNFEFFEYFVKQVREHLASTCRSDIRMCVFKLHKMIKSETFGGFKKNYISKLKLKLKKKKSCAQSQFSRYLSKTFHTFSVVSFSAVNAYLACPNFNIIYFQNNCTG